MCRNKPNRPANSSDDVHTTRGATNMKRLLRGLAAAIGLMACAATAQAQAPDTLAQIKQRGTIIVGIKNDYKPWGFLNPSGQIVGLEIDLVDDIAKKIG